MNSIFRPYLRKFILVFFDDSLVYRSNWSVHFEHVKKDFEILRHHNFFIKISNCIFGQQELEYLGHIVTSQGVQVDENKIKAMMDWYRPTNISELRGFCGSLTTTGRLFVTMG